MALSQEAIQAYTKFCVDWRGRIDFDPARVCDGMMKKLKGYLADDTRKAKHAHYQEQLRFYENVAAVIREGGVKPLPKEDTSGAEAAGTAENESAGASGAEAPADEPASDG